MSDVEDCHELHYLQMACEKIAKAYRLRDLEDVDVDELAKSHLGFEKFVNAFLRSPQVLDEYAGKRDAHRRFCAGAARLARQIEKLAPAVDSALSPWNAEYPWEDDERVVVPCAYSYPNLSLLNASGGRAFLKIVGRAFRDYRSVTIE